MGHVKMHSRPSVLLSERSEALDGLTHEVDQLEAYFRNIHRVGSERLTPGNARRFLQRYSERVALTLALRVKSLLSVGISWGLPEAYIAGSTGMRVVGTDYRSEKTDVYAAYAAARGVSVVQWDICREPMDQSKLGSPFDMVWCCDLLEHLRMKPEIVVPELCAAVGHQGALLITVPNVAGFSNVVRLLRGDNFIEPLAPYNRQQLAAGQTVFDSWMHVREPSEKDVVGWLTDYTPADFEWQVWLPRPNLSLRGRNLKGIAGLALELTLRRLRDSFYCLGRRKVR